MRIPALLMAVVMSFGLAATQSFAQSVGSPARGKDLSQQLCADCHSVEKATLTSPKRRAPPFTAVAKTRGMTAMALSVWLQTSHPTMPNILLKPDTSDDIIAYILSLRVPSN